MISTGVRPICARRLLVTGRVRISVSCALHHKMTLDHDIWQQVRSVRSELDTLMKRVGTGKKA